MSDLQKALKADWQLPVFEGWSALDEGDSQICDAHHWR